MTAERAVAGLLLAALAAAAPAAAQESAPQRVDEGKAIEAAEAERAAGRLEEAENLLRGPLREAWSPRIGVALAGVLLQRAQGLDTASELMRSLRDGILGEALALYERAAADEGMRIDATIGRAACHVVAGRIAEADGELAAALKTQRDDGGAVEGRRRLLRERVRLLADHGEGAKALALIAEAIAAGEFDDAAARFEELVVAAASNEPAAITAAAVTAVKAGAEPFDVAYLCYDAVGEAHLETLLHLYSKLLEVRPHEPALLFYRGFVRMWMGDAAGALADLDPCRGDARIGARAQLQYGGALVRLNRAEEALPLFEKLAQPGGVLLGKALDGIWDVAVARATRRDFDGALVLFREILARNPTHLGARIGEPLCLRSLGRYDQAAAAYEAGIAALPEDSRLLNDYALMLDAHGERARALETFERALGAGSPDAGENLGILAYREKHDPELAARYFARTLTILNEGKLPARPRILFYRELCLAEVTSRPPR